MLLARVVGHVTATIKDARLVGHKLLLVSVVDGAATPTGTSLVVADACGAGQGDVVLVATGSAARVAPATSGVSTDATAVAVVDEINLEGLATYKA